MTEYDYWKIFPRMPKKVTIGDITIRDGFQHEEKTISTAAKIFYAEEMILAGCREIELTNLGNPAGIPQFRDAEQVLAYFRGDRFRKNCERRGIHPAEITFTAVTIREKAVDTAIELRKRGIGPDRILMMVSTDPEHHYANSGTTLSQYWKEVEQCIQRAADAGIKMNGTVSTIWGSPITGATRLEDAVEFTKRFLELGAHDIEHADHDGSATPAQVYRYYSMILDEIPNTDLHIGHFHVTRGWGLANVLAALQAGIDIFEGTLGGLGGQPANFLDRVPVPGTGSYYYKDPNVVGLATFEDMCVMLDEMGIDLCGVNVDRILELGTLMERTIGRRLRSEAILNGRVPKEPREEFKRAGLSGLKAKLKEKPDQLVPEGWPQKAVVPPEVLKRKL